MTHACVDGEYEDGRHPKSVSFTLNLTEDLNAGISLSTPWPTTRPPGQDEFGA